ASTILRCSLLRAASASSRVVVRGVCSSSPRRRSRSFSSVIRESCVSRALFMQRSLGLRSLCLTLLLERLLRRLLLHALLRILVLRRHHTLLFARRCVTNGSALPTGNR